MGKKYYFIFGAILTCLAANLFCLEDDKTKISEENRILETELALARTQSSYFVFDLSEKIISLKAKGFVLRKWDIKKMKYWGNPLAVRAYHLLKKSTWFPPQRKKIEPGETAGKDSFELDLFELKDMPSDYSLYLEQGIKIAVRPKTKKLFSMIRNFGRSVSWYVFLPIKTTWLSVRKKKFTEIDVVLPDEKEAKALFWSFLESQSCIFYYTKQF